jgi:hypothetical protein
MSEYKIAAGHNNAAGLTALHLLLPGSFGDYAAGVLTEWHDYEDRLRSGSGGYKPIGKPWVAWVFFRLTRAELLHLRTTFCPTGEDALVTIRTLDKRADAFANFNARLIWPDGSAAWLRDEWRDVRIELRELAGI